MTINLIEKSEYKILAKTLFGLEDVLYNEIIKLGGKNVKKLNRAVETEGDTGFIYKCNLYLRTALAVYLRIKTGKTRNQNDLYDFVRQIDWDKLFSINKTFAIEAVVTNSVNLNHSRFVEQKVKDGIADYFRDRSGRRPNVNRDRPDVKIYVHINNDICSIFLNSSGTPLYYRGYNKRTGKAPINDLLAAGMVILSDWDKKTLFYDPMCGCGTIAAEAYMIAKNIPPAIKRNYFSFKNWLNYDDLLWEKTKSHATEMIIKDEPDIIAADIDSKVIQDAKINMNRIDTHNKVSFITEDFFESSPKRPKGIIITNPPYGHRIETINIAGFYKNFGAKLKFGYDNFTVWVITPESEAVKFIGLKPEIKKTLFNGPLECKLFKYSIYKGSIRGK